MPLSRHVRTTKHTQEDGSRNSRRDTGTGRFYSSTVGTNAQILIVCLLVCASLAVVVVSSLMSASGTSTTEYFSADYCQAESPKPQDVYACYMTQCTFDVSLCSEQCPFGFTKDERNCDSRCTCAEKGIFEGDIYFDETELPNLIAKYGYRYVDQDFATFAGSATAFEDKLWNENFVGGKYVIKYALKNDLKEKSVENIRKGLVEFHDNTCLKFEEVPIGYRGMHILFANAGFCSSPVGRYSDRWADNTPVTIGSNCALNSVLHELLHTLGFHHEQARPDRDAYVQLFEENMMESMKYNFDKVLRSEVRDLNSEYDIKSIMHYSSGAFSKNWRSTMVSRHGGSLGGIRFSEEDLLELNALYKCPTRSTDSVMEWGEWSNWSRCDSTCGPGKILRFRKCISRTPGYARYCEGEASERADCKIQPCPGEWGEWRPDGTCTTTCGRGRIWMVRECNDINGKCYGRRIQLDHCNAGSCKKNALWTSWSNWSQCRASCGQATATRSRFCQDSQGVRAKTCDFRKSDNQDQVRSCDLPTCESLSKNWGSWSQCSATCEGYRKRTCVGGACTTREEVENCATRPCKEPDIFSKRKQSLNINDVCNAAFTMENWVFGDFNGDGRVDIVCLDMYGVYQLSQGSNSGFMKVWSGSFAKCGQGKLIHGDVNGDGKDDLICKSKRERSLLIKYAADRSFHDEVIKGGDFCAKYSSSLTVITISDQTRLFCHYRDHDLEIRGPNL